MDLRNVAKTYRRKVRALRGIEMRVHRGEIFGLLGPNGAGKTTLVKIMMTVVRPDRAEGTVLGRAIGNKQVLGRIGYLPEEPRFPPYLTGREALDYYGALEGIDRSTRRRRAGELLETVGLTEAADVKVATYSKGMGQRLGIAQSLINDPELILLDEPGEGVDPVGRKELRQVLVDLRGRGKTVFLNTHLLGELEMICDRVAILLKGAVVKQGTLEELTQERKHYALEVALAGGGDLVAAVRGALRADLQLQASGVSSPSQRVARGTLPGGQAVELADSLLRVDLADPESIQPIIDALRAKDIVILEVRPVRQSLEDLFVESVTGNSEAHLAPPATVTPPPINPPDAAAQGGGA